MRSVALLVAALLGACVAAFRSPAPDGPDPGRVERGALVTENVAEIPPAVTERLFQYRQSRGASLQGWVGDGILVRTRFGDTQQIHRVAFPGGARQQVTFFPEPVARRATTPFHPCPQPIAFRHPRVPVGEAEQIVRAIRAQGGDVWYMRANDEGHGFQKKPNLDYLFAVMVLFLQQHLVGGER